MSRDWLSRWMWGKFEPERELPLPLPIYYGLPVVDVPPMPRVRPPHDAFIGGAVGFWCGKCWGTVEVWTSRSNPECPKCHGPIRFIASLMAQVETDAGERE